MSYVVSFIVTGKQRKQQSSIFDKVFLITTLEIKTCTELRVVSEIPELCPLLEY